MLSDHERKTLREVEYRFKVEDPAFTRSFEATQKALPRHPYELGGRIALVAAALLPVFILIAGALITALVFAVATGLIWLAWRHSVDTDSRAP